MIIIIVITTIVVIVTVTTNLSSAYALQRWFSTGLPECAVWHSTPATTCVALHPALQLLVPLPGHQRPTAMADAAQGGLPPPPQVHPLLAAWAPFPMVPVLALLFIRGCPDFALAPGDFAEGLSTTAVPIITLQPGGSALMRSIPPCKPDQPTYDE